jgi:hypothetical protein
MDVACDSLEGKEHGAWKTQESKVSLGLRTEPFGQTLPSIF